MDGRSQHEDFRMLTWIRFMKNKEWICISEYGIIKHRKKRPDQFHWWIGSMYHISDNSVIYCSCLSHSSHHHNFAWKRYLILRKLFVISNTRPYKNPSPIHHPSHLNSNNSWKVKISLVYKFELLELSTSNPPPDTTFSLLLFMLFMRSIQPMNLQNLIHHDYSIMAHG